MKFKARLDYTEEFLPGDIIEFLSEDEVTVHRYEFLANPVKDSLKLHTYFVTKQNHLQALAELPEYTEVYGEYIVEIDAVFNLKGENPNYDSLVENIDEWESEGVIKYSLPNDGEDIYQHGLKLPNTVYVRPDYLIRIGR